MPSRSPQLCPVTILALEQYSQSWYASAHQPSATLSADYSAYPWSTARLSCAVYLLLVSPLFYTQIFPIMDPVSLGEGAMMILQESEQAASVQRWTRSVFACQNSHFMAQRRRRHDTIFGAIPPSRTNERSESQSNRSKIKRPSLTLPSGPLPSLVPNEKFFPIPQSLVSSRLEDGISNQPGRSKPRRLLKNLESLAIALLATPCPSLEFQISFRVVHQLIVVHSRGECSGLPLEVPQTLHISRGENSRKP